MNAAELLIAFDALHVIDRERVAKVMIEEARTADLLAEVRKRYDAVSEADTIVRFSTRILRDDQEIQRVWRVLASEPPAANATSVGAT